MHLRITTENDAFQGGNGPAEVARILRRLADRIEGGETSGNLRDVNGNRVGDFHAEDRIPDEAEAETIDAAHGVTIAPVPASECGAGSVEWDVFREGEHVSSHETRDAAAQAAQELADKLDAADEKGGAS